jgi:hypothetical protein
MKLTIVGGGSTYTPELIDGLVRMGLDVGEIALQDVSSERLGDTSASSGCAARPWSSSGTSPGCSASSRIVPTAEALSCGVRSEAER